MSRHHPLSWKRPQRRCETRTFTDPSQPGAEVTFTLIEPDVMALVTAGAVAREMTDRYVTGKEGVHEAVPFVVGGEIVETSFQFWYHVATMYAIQAGAEKLGYDPYTPEEIGAFAIAMPHAWP